MFKGTIGFDKNHSLMGEYSSKLGEAVLRGRIRQAEKSARIEADIANRIKSEFISNMSHELRTPLNTVIGFSKLIAEHDRRPLPDAEIVDYARLINDAACNLLTIINDILDISKLQSGHFRLDANDVNLDDVLEAVVAALKNSATTSGVTVNLQLPTAAVVVKGDSLKLRQVFGNLIGNAVKFTSTGGTVAIDVGMDSDGSIAVTIVDTGVGMDQEEIEVALCPFGQVDGARTRWREGTGLGLPIAKALIELHGGRFSIKSAKSVGTEIRVHLPSPEFVKFMQQDLGIQSSRI